MANEPIGGVVVTIGGDFSPLLAGANAASAAAAAAGQSIGSSIAAGATQASGATVNLTTVIQQFTQAIAEQNAVLSLSIQRNMAYAQSVSQGGAAAHGSVSEIQAVGAAIRTAFGEQSIRAVERFLAMIPGVGVALQLAFPLIGLTALYEMFSRVIGKTDDEKSALEQLKSAAEEADKALAGLVKTGDSLLTHAAGRDLGPAAGAEAKAQQLKREAQDIGAQINDLQNQVDGASIRYAAQHPLRAPLSSEDIKSWNPPEVVTEREALNKKIDALTDQQAAKQAEANSAEADAGKARTEQAGTLASRRIEIAEQAAQRFAEISRQGSTSEINAQHAANQAKIEGITGVYDRTVALGQEEIRFEKAKQDAINGYALATRDRTITEITAKAAAQSAGKTPPEQALIQAGAQGDIGKAQDDYALARGKAALDVQAAEQNAILGTADLARRTQKEIEDESKKSAQDIVGSQTKFLEEGNRLISERVAKLGEVAEIEAKAAGQSESLRIEGQKIALEGQYAAQLQHTSDQHIAYLQQIASLEADSNAAKIKGLELERDLAEASGEVVKAAEIQARIDAERQQGKNQQTQAQGQITTAQNQASPGAQLQAQLAQWSSQNLRQDIGLAIEQGFSRIPQALGSALASGVFGGGKKGEDVGKQVGDALKGIGKQVLGEAFSAIISKLIAQIVIQTGIQALFNALFPVVTTAQVVAITANTAALIALTDAMIITSFFADGTPSAPGGLAMVGERGPEIVNLPRGSQVIPNHMLKGYADGAGVSSVVSGGGSINIQNLSVHAHGITDPSQFTEHVFRAIPRVAKNRTATQSPYSR